MQRVNKPFCKEELGTWGDNLRYANQLILELNQGIVEYKTGANIPRFTVVEGNFTHPK